MSRNASPTGVLLFLLPFELGFDRVLARDRFGGLKGVESGTHAFLGPLSWTPRREIGLKSWDF